MAVVALRFRTRLSYLLSPVGSVNYSRKPHKQVQTWFNETSQLHTSCPVRGFLLDKLPYGAIKWWTKAGGVYDKFHDGSKLFVVDGNIAVGKTTLAKRLAEEMDMKYVPEATLNTILKLIDKDVSEDTNNEFWPDNLSLAKFYKDPFADGGAHAMRLQTIMFCSRWIQWCLAVRHLTDTGQGLVMDRSVWSDMVFMEAMFAQKYFKKRCYDYYYDMKQICLGEYTAINMLPPHAIIYLDAPVDVLQERIKKRALDFEQNKISNEYLLSLENAYKNKFLPEMKKRGVEVLQYDWSDLSKYESDVEIMIEDLDNLEYKDNPWTYADEEELHNLRVFLANDYQISLKPQLDHYIPEVVVEGEDMKKLMEMFYEMYPFARGYKKRTWPDKIAAYFTI